MSETFKTVINPFDNKLQLIADGNNKAEKSHNHQISEVSGLADILQLVINADFSENKGGYFIE